MAKTKQYTLYKLFFKNGFHIGEREGFFESSDFIIHSDTLFSAFINGFLLLYGKTETEEFLNKFLTSPLFLISSAFPFKENTYYFPIPKDQILIRRDLKDVDVKKIKKKKFVNKDLFQEFINGKDINSDDIINCIKDDEEDFFKRRIVPRVSLSRFSNHPLPEGGYFHFGEVWFKESCGLFFLVEFKNDEIEKIFDSVMNLLQHEGIGGDRTIGKGLFKYEKGKINLEIPENTEWVIILSIYFPKEEEIADLKEGFYEIIERRGYVFSPYIKTLKRDILRMFEPGSVFPSHKEGKIEEVAKTNCHPVYRYGLAMSLPYFKKEVENENRD